MAEKWLEGMDDVFAAIDAGWSDEDRRRAEAEFAGLQRLNEQRRHEQLRRQQERQRGNAAA